MCNQPNRDSECCIKYFAGKCVARRFWLLVKTIPAFERHTNLLPASLYIAAEGTNKTRKS
jgi:hypothetical protein